MATEAAKTAIPERKGIRKGIYILPNLFTTASLFSGFYGIISSLKGHALAATLDGLTKNGVAESVVESFNGGHAAVSHFYEISAWAILVSAAFDSMDGAVARLTRTTSDFGAEYDSLCDLVAFGVAPAVLMYSWALEPFQRFGWLACFIYVACAALRLARFNVQSGDVESKSFQGLPSPGAAGVISTTVLFYLYLSNFGGDEAKKVTWLLKQNVLELPHWIFLAITFMAAFMMVGNIRYRSSKNLDPLKRLPFVSLLAAIGLISLVAAEPHLTLFAIVMTYFLSGPLEWFLFYRHRKQGVHGPSDDLYKEDDADLRSSSDNKGE
jgi:CDP-diacylglycerol--serine O-phosphatidyltransferase